MFIKITMPGDKRNQNSEVFFLADSSGIWLFATLGAIQCLECVSMTRFLFISRTIEADSGTQGSSPFSLISLLIALGVAMTWHPKQSNPVVMKEIL
jgi:hypothetical protein